MTSRAARGAPSEGLRHASEAAHAATEQVPLLAKLATGDLSDADYVRVMAAFAALFEAIVFRIQAMPGGPDILALTDLAARARQARADVRVLGIADQSDALQVPFIRGSGSALGATYALEGARLGGTVIGARLRRAGRPVGAPGYGFFELSGVPVAAEWRAFKRRLDLLLVQEDVGQARLLRSRKVSLEALQGGLSTWFAARGICGWGGV